MCLLEDLFTLIVKYVIYGFEYIHTVLPTMDIFDQIIQQM